MANTFLVTLHGVSLTLPDGSTLFHDLHAALGSEVVGLIGRSGSGKTTFGKLVSGDLAASSGRIERAVAVRQVEQQAGAMEAASLAQLAGLDQTLGAARAGWPTALGARATWSSSAIAGTSRRAGWPC